ncbi:DNA polymerase III subunit delta' [Gallibacterium salpingitidis]|uniref:DNA polymerase III subunit delta' n=1 Tax=Gallibacterium salpingitidis TaxID=505341 RepID=A0AB36DZK1_9PAST|nr:DNA polymerase III subunit delta' [Gallibacterium salpingitidis]OBX06597.1 DNA polymerase III subunit delta' [Gallibacterium salpingitidis]OBX06892.1 DNA polymerase III subunit delta' [Gallibacterium salpingitidis]WKS98717.1 DNA polymerase III subunit delta' [Gallibacterium salpingitidis]
MVPTTQLAELFWLLPTYQRITQAFLAGYGHHALLIRSANDNGAEPFCFALAQWLFCEHKQEGQACGHCRKCQLFQHQSHPDFYLITAEKGKKIGIEAIREVTDKLSRHSQQQAAKVVYIQGVELLTEAAANALLKTLEEPTDNCYFLLQTNVEQQILATIYSRCQLWALPLPNQEQGMQWLSEQGFQQRDEMQVALAMNYGRPFAAKISLQQGKIAQRLAFLRQFWKFYRSRNMLLLMPYFQQENPIPQLNWLEALLMDALKASLSIHSGWQCEDLRQGVTALAQELPALKIYQGLSIVRRMRTDLLSINGVNQELIIADGLIEMIEQVFEG